MRFLAAFFCLIPALGAAQFVPVGSVDPNECDYQRIAGGDGLIAGQALYEFDAPTALKSLWPALTGQPAEAAPTRNIDWVHQRAIAVALGDMPEGTTVNITSIRRQNGRWVVKAGEISGGGFGSRRQGGGSGSRPWVLVAVERKVRNPVLAIERYQANSGIVFTNPGYGNPYNPYPPAFNEPYGACPYIILNYGGNCAVSEETSIVITTPVGFVSWYHDSLGQTGTAPLPKIDWTTERLVAVHAGRLANPGLVIQVKGVRRTTKGLIIDAAMVPGQGGSSPWSMVRLPAGNEPVQVEFTKR